MTAAERAGAGLALLVAAGPAGADVVCSGSNASLNLGAYESYSPAPLDSSIAFTVSCSRDGGPRQVTVNVGLGPSFVSGSIADRQSRLATGTDALAYNLYREAARVSVWGETAGVNTVAQSIDLVNKSSGTLTFTIFARIAALQDVRAGSYADRVRITIDF